jgi:hypothetical protein
MSDNLRSKMIRLAASMPKGSNERKALLDVLAAVHDGDDWDVSDYYEKLAEDFGRKFNMKPKLPILVSRLYGKLKVGSMYLPAETVAGMGKWAMQQEVDRMEFGPKGLTLVWGE